MHVTNKYNKKYNSIFISNVLEIYLTRNITGNIREIHWKSM